ncbi:MAG: type II 3-dehydroquinate dehydratase [Bacteroidetes bacterium]|nr:type II 3-dehydroquinate dehydratase [Bacteroidota bacterium]
MKILIINGPNLNLLGKREPTIYGNQSFEDYLDVLKKQYSSDSIDYYQSNIEGELINAIHSADGEYEGVVLNAGAYTHTSIAIADAIGSVSVPVVEVHLSCILSRESFRHISLIAPKCKGSIMGFGMNSYRLGIESLLF